jgi:hypothetical protein
MLSAAKFVTISQICDKLGENLQGVGNIATGTDLIKFCQKNLTRKLSPDICSL